MELDDDWYRDFKAALSDEGRWREYFRITSLVGKEQTGAAWEIPPVPDIDARALFWTMMTESNQPDQIKYPALKRLRASGLFGLAALSNTMIFPDGHPLQKLASDDVRTIFDVFVSSAHVGMRKPERRIYEYTLDRVREKWGPDLKPEHLLFLDDIGENLKMARSLGMRTIKVILGKTDDAVRELEKVTGLDLLEGGAGKPCRANL